MVGFGKRLMLEKAAREATNANLAAALKAYEVAVGKDAAEKLAIELKKKKSVEEWKPVTDRKGSSKVSTAKDLPEVGGYLKNKGKTVGDSSEVRVILKKKDTDVAVAGKVSDLSEPSSPISAYKLFDEMSEPDLVSEAVEEEDTTLTVTPEEVCDTIATDSSPDAVPSSAEEGFANSDVDATKDPRIAAPVVSDLSKKNFPLLPSQLNSSVSVTLGEKDTSSESSKEEVQAEVIPNVYYKEHFARNRHLSSGTRLEYYKPSGGKVKLEEHVIDRASKFDFSLVGYYAGKFPGLGAFKGLLKSWKAKASYTFHDSGWIIFSFDSEDEMLTVLNGGPYMTYGIPLLLKRKPDFFAFDDKDLTVYPVWVQLESLPLELWTTEAIGQICSLLGKPLYSDKCTTNKTRVSFARALVEMDIAKPLPNGVEVELPNGNCYMQRIRYERLPKYCTYCNRVGHNTDNCAKFAEMKARIVAKKKEKEKEAAKVKEKEEGAIKLIDSLKSVSVPVAVDVVLEKLNEEVPEEEEESVSDNEGSAEDEGEDDVYPVHAEVSVSEGSKGVTTKGAASFSRGPSKAAGKAVAPQAKKAKASKGKESLAAVAEDEDGFTLVDRNKKWKRKNEVLQNQSVLRGGASSPRQPP